MTDVDVGTPSVEGVPRYVLEAPPIQRWTQYAIRLQGPERLVGHTWVEAEARKALSDYKRHGEPDAALMAREVVRRIEVTTTEYAEVNE